MQIIFQGSKVVIAIILSASITVISLGVCTCFFWRRHLTKSHLTIVQNSDMSDRTKPSPVLNRFNPLSIRGSIPEIEYRHIEAATDNFSEANSLSKGVHGAVLYKAQFGSSSYATVKKLDVKNLICEREFENEIMLLGNIKHSNIISLIGYCVHANARLLVYEFMHNGSLEMQLHGSSRGANLPWHIRMKIALDIARGLEYLHEHCSPPMMCRALNSCKILLESNFNAKISDFGQALTSGGSNEHITNLSEFEGYLAPECFLNEVTGKSDVYAFGIILFELLLGKKPVTGTQSQYNITWLTDRHKLPDLVDPVIRHTMDVKHLCQAAAVAVLCVQKEPSYRPLITDVVFSLIPLVPKVLGGTLDASTDL